MLCETCLELILPYLEHELDDRQKEAFEEHSKACERCKNELSLMQSILSCSSEIGQNPPREITDGVMKKIKADKRRQLMKILSPTAVAAVLILAVGLNFNTVLSLFGSFDGKQSAAGSVQDASVKESITHEAEGDNAVDSDRTAENFTADSTSSYNAQSTTKSSLEDNAVIGGSKAATAPDVSAFLPFSAAERYSLKSKDTFRYGLLIKASDESKLTENANISVYIKGEPSLYVSALPLTELEKLLNELGIKFVDKTEDSTNFSGLDKNVAYGFIILEN